MPTELATELRGRLEAGEAIQFDLQDLQIRCYLAGAAKSYVALPLWNAIKCQRLNDRVVVVERIITAKVDITLGG